MLPASREGSMVGISEIVLLAILATILAIAALGSALLLFLFLSARRRSRSTATATASSTSTSTTSAVDLSRFDELEDAERQEVIGHLLEQVGSRLGLEGARVKPRPDEGETDLRGRLAGRPVRLEVTDSGWLGVSIKQPSALMGLCLSWDPEKLAKDADPDDDWADQDELRVFVAPGVYLEGDAESIDENLAMLDQIPPDARARLLTRMAKQKLFSIILTSDETSARSGPDLTDLPNPVDGLVRLVQSVAEVADIAATVPALHHQDDDNDDDDDDVGSGRRAVVVHHRTVRCRYCTAMHVVREPFRCPNCGAPTA